ncbi:SPFH/Band 7/PHB domain protein [Alphaproteobacteria bacterium]|jgi:regulator of protease activity HflC (stomatin/prohibitin superfamily)|nr:SPFH/Band 7/PHB domain protein [Alphaproteobacteria bacterium]|tara:strand:+ start:334 stop:1257 length:924 start_codon:yes stop_codon:yes gene_type:complete
MEVFYNLSSIISILFFGFVILTIYLGVKIVPQSDVFIIERFGKYSKTLSAGLSIIIPYLDKVAHKISILERQLKEFTISVISKDNVEVKLETTVFYRLVDASRSVYRIRDVQSAINTAATSIVRSAAGRLELDDLQSSRDSMNEEISKNLQQAAEVWGIEITRTEITDIIVDEQTRTSQRQQLNAERTRRATIAEAEGEKRSVELKADAKLYEAQREAEAIKITADADAYSIKAKAKADAEQTHLLAEAIAKNGQPAINFEIMKRQVDAIGVLASSPSSKTLILPTDITGILGGIETLMHSLTKKGK